MNEKIKEFQKIIEIHAISEEAKNKCIEKYDEEMNERYKNEIEEIEKAAEAQENKYRATKNSFLIKLFTKDNIYAQKISEMCKNMEKERKLFVPLHHFQ